MATSQLTRSTITLRGSTDIVTEFFGYCINSILYQRGIYPPESFSRVKKYGLTMLVTNDESIKTYLQEVLAQLRDWLLNSVVQKLVIVICGAESGEVLERWVFNIECDKDVSEETKREKDQKEIMGEIQAIIRQITASVTFLPLLEEPCSFDMQVYTDTDVHVPDAWEESAPKTISNSEEVRLRSFSTKIHKVDGLVSYKIDE